MFDPVVAMWAERLSHLEAGLADVQVELETAELTEELRVELAKPVSPTVAGLPTAQAPQVPLPEVAQADSIDC